jgi:hypothetical protein
MRLIRLKKQTILNLRESMIIDATTGTYNFFVEDAHFRLKILDPIVAT